MIKFKRLTQTAQIPKRATDGAAGFDLSFDGDSMELFPGERYVFKTGISMETGEGMWGEIKPRSGWSVKYGVDVLAGVIDSDYTGELKVVLINHGDRSLHINHGDRIAQIIINSYVSEFKEVAAIEATNRGTSGFGSTGVN